MDGKKFERPNNMRKTLVILVSILLVGAVAAASSLAQEKKTVAVLLSGDIPPYRDALAGFKDELKGGPYAVAYEEFIFKSEEREDLKKKIAALKPDMIFSVGTQASLFAGKNFGDIPVVFSMVLNPVENGVIASVDSPGGNITGVSLNIPVDLQFRALKKIKSGILRIGMLYNAKTGSASVDEAKNAAKDMSVEIAAEPVFSEHDISGALDKVLSKADSLWASPEPMIYNSSTAQGIILETLKNRVPFMSFSKNFVKAGALLALESDYNDIGRQSGIMAAKVMAQNSAREVKTESPRKTMLTINTKTADAIGLKIEKDILDKAEVYGN